MVFWPPLLFTRRAILLLACVLTTSLPVALAGCQDQSASVSEPSQTRSIVTAQPLTAEETLIPGIPAPKGAPGSQSFRANNGTPSVSPAPVAAGANQTHGDELSGLFQQLVTGEYFHTIPAQMTVQQPILIEAGVAEAVTQEMFDTLGITGPISVEQGLTYNPLGVELRLMADPNAFKIQPISSGRKAVITGYPEVWQWSVTPLKGGRQLLQLEAIVYLNQPNSAPQQQTLLLSSTTVPVEASLGYQIQSAASQYGLNVLTGGAVVGGLLLGWQVSRPKRRVLPLSSPGTDYGLPSSEEGQS